MKTVKLCVQHNKYFINASLYKHKAEKLQIQVKTLCRVINQNKNIDYSCFSVTLFAYWVLNTNEQCFFLVGHQVHTSKTVLKMLFSVNIFTQQNYSSPKKSPHYTHMYLVKNVLLIIARLSLLSVDGSKCISTLAIHLDPQSVCVAASVVDQYHQKYFGTVSGYTYKTRGSVTAGCNLQP